MARQQMRRMDDRISATQRLMAANAEMTDAERVRFTAYLERLQNQRAEIDLTLNDSSERMDQMTDARINSAADYRLSNAETVLRAVDGKMDRMSEQISDLSTRQRLLENQVQSLSNEMQRLGNQVEQMRSPAGYSRVYLAMGALAMTVVIVLLLIVTWRLL